MNENLKKKVDLMVENYSVLKEDFIWDGSLVKHFAAMINANKDKKVDLRKIHEISDYIKSETSCFSYFRGHNKFMMANILAFEDDYKAMFKKIESIYDKLKDNGFKNSEYLPLAAYTITKETEDNDIEFRIKRMRSFYEKMEKNHWWLTSSDDYVLSAVLATTDLEVEETSNKIEECYNALKDNSFTGCNELQTLSHILALGEEDVNKKVTRVMDLYEGLKTVKCKISYSGLPSLGVLALITDDIKEVLEEAKEIHDYIYEKSGYGFWSLDRNMRVILALNLISAYYVENIKSEVLEVTLANSINAILIAQEQATVAACIAVSAAAASSSSC